MEAISSGKVCEVIIEIKNRFTGRIFEVAGSYQSRGKMICRAVLAL